METLEILKDVDDILTFTELKELLKISKNKAYELLQTGKIKSIKVGRIYRIPKTSIIEYLKN